MLSIFSKTKGKIKYYSLNNLWSNFTKEEKKLILSTYKKGNCDDLIKNKIKDTNENVLIFLCNFAKWFEKPELFLIASKIIDKCEELIINSKFLNEDIYYFYSTAIQIYYRNRSSKEEYLEIAKIYCEKQIELFKQIKNSTNIPAPIGYQRLTSIYESMSEFEKAIAVCKEALSNNIPGDWNKKILKLEKKIKEKV